MPSGIDFTREIRQCPSVQQMILLGETDSSTCGNMWATWGVVPTMGCARCNQDPDGCERCDYGIYPETIPFYTEDGFARHQLSDISRWQLCRFDSAAATGFSDAVAFNRID